MYSRQKLKLKIIIITFLNVLFIQACSTAPSSEQKENENSFIKNHQVEDIKQRHEALYEKKLKELKKKDPKKDALAAIAKGDLYLMAYHSGRGGSRKVPGLMQQQIAFNSRCKYQTISGFGDSIYGAYHLKYRTERRKYASKFNKTIFSHCKFTP